MNYIQLPNYDPQVDGPSETATIGSAILRLEKEPKMTKAKTPTPKPYSPPDGPPQPKKPKKPKG